MNALHTSRAFLLIRIRTGKIMDPLARKLITIYEKPAQPTNTTIFGSVMSMPRSLVFRPPYRIAIYPCRSSTAPETAMGLFTALAFLLERWSDTQVYRLFAKLSEDDTYDWTIAQSQFEVEDWALDGLDDNITLYGDLTANPSGWLLSVTVENDLIEDEDDAVSTFTHQAADIAGLVAWLPELATLIAEELGAEQVEPIGMIYDSTALASHPQLETLLKQAFDWELRLWFWLAGQAWEDDDMLTAHTALRETAQSDNSDFAAWIIAHATARTLLPGVLEIGEKLIDTPADIVAEHPQSRMPAIILAGGLYRAQQADAAYEMLEAEITAYPNTVATRLRLIDLYKRVGRFNDEVNALQDAIRQHATNRMIYYLYALEVQGMYENISIEDVEMEFILTEEAADDAVHRLAREALAAYEAALQIDPLDKPTLSNLALLVKDIDTKRFWEVFGTLVEQDTNGDVLRGVVDALYTLDDIDPAITLLDQKAKALPERLDLQLNLAAVYLVAEDYEAAQKTLENALSKTDDLATRSEIELMKLTANDPEFEQRFGDLSMTISAGTSPSNDDVDFLEAAVENAPSFAAGHLLLAKAYTLWEDSEATMEVLLDAQKTLGDDPDILDALAEALWNAGEQKLAFDYLNRGLRKHPNHLSLLVRGGRYLFESDQLAQARIYLSRAETINPRDVFLAETRVFIANQVAEDPERYELDQEEDAEPTDTADED
jgi:tetratricopeptide (TPR) repeat protein